MYTILVSAIYWLLAIQIKLIIDLLVSSRIVILMCPHLEMCQ